MRVSTRRMVVSAIGVISLCCLFISMAMAATAESVLRQNDRIIFVGDSITGQGGNNQDGFVHQIEWALKQVHPEGNFTVIPLGGSGQSVGSWMNVEKRSRDNSAVLDVKGIDVKATLDQPADVLIIMLGMNDLLAPYISARTEDLDGWVSRYTQLMTAIRDRVKPRVVALGTVTLCSENPESPKNRMRDELNRRIVELARAQQCIVLPTGQTMLETLNKGRAFRSDFHVLQDFVHPNNYGHAAIANGMLTGLGEDAAAEQVAGKYLANIAKLQPGQSTAISCSLRALPSDGASQSFEVHYQLSGGAMGTPSVTLNVPEGWQVSPASANTANGVFRVTTTAQRIVTTVTLQAKSAGTVSQADISVPAPWLIGTGIINASAWQGGKFAPDKAAFPWENDLAKGVGLGTQLEGTNGQKLSWTPYLATPNFTGGATPASIDFTAVSFGANFEAGYAGRWVYSSKDRPVQIQLGSQTFAGVIGLTIWLNGENLYAKTITDEPRKRTSVDAHLTSGWNLLLVKCNHFNWQWQASVELAGLEGDNLDDLRYAATPTAPTAPAK